MALPTAHVPGFEYLRVSITDRCNLRCVYCMPAEGVAKLGHDGILRYEQILTIIRAAVAEGVHRVRITGGEPLVRKGLTDFVRQVAGLPGLDDVSMTTNGVLLETFAADLVQAGLRRVNVSLDSLQPERFHRITRLGEIGQVLAGIKKAIAVGLAPVKVNVVIIPGENDDEIEAFGRLARESPIHIRFIERMPFGSGEEGVPFVAQTEVFERLSREMRLLPDGEESGGGPAEVFRIEGGEGRIGFISSRTRPFCVRCHRLRLTAAGKLLPCLDSREGADVAGLEGEAIRAVIRDLARRKAERGKSCAGFLGARCVSLSDIGG